MIRLTLRDPHATPVATVKPRRRFGLDAPLPADPRVIERAVLRHLDECHPTILVLATARAADAPENAATAAVDLARGVPDLLLLLPGGRLACLKIKTHAQTLSRAQKAFADLCRERSIPFHVVRSLGEARPLLHRFAQPPAMEPAHG